jgi:hypothetical protein
MSSCAAPERIDPLRHFATAQRVHAAVDLGAQQALLRAGAAVGVLDGRQAIVAHATLRKRRDAKREIDGDVARHAVGHDAVGESDAQRLVGGDGATGENEVERVRQTDEVRQAHRAAVDERHAPAAAKDAEHRAALDDAQIAPERELETAGDGVAADCGDPRLLGLEARRPERRGARRLQADGVVERAQIGARTKGAVGAGEHADVHRGVGVDGNHGLEERVGGGLVDGVARVQAIDGDNGNADALCGAATSGNGAKEPLDHNRRAHFAAMTTTSGTASISLRARAAYSVDDAGVEHDAPERSESEFARALEADFKQRAQLLHERASAGAADAADVVGDNNSADVGGDESKHKSAAARTDADATEKQWFEIYQNLTNARGEIDQARSLIEALAARRFFEAPQLPTMPASAESAAQQRRIAVQAKREQLNSAATKIFVHCESLRAQLAADRVYFSQLRQLCQRWRLVLADNGTLMFDYVPLLTAARDLTTALERAVCVRVQDGNVALRLPAMRALALGRRIGVYCGARRIASVQGPIAVPPRRAAEPHGVEHCDELLVRARQSVWLERMFLQLGARGGRVSDRRGVLWPRIAARASIAPSALCSASPTTPSRSRSRSSWSPVPKIEGVE